MKGNFFSGTTHTWAERLAVLDANTLPVAHYLSSTGWLDNRPAITVRVERNARVFYVGTWLDNLSQQALMKHILDVTGRKGIATPDGVELTRRVRQDGEEIHFLINHERHAQSVRLPWKSHDHLSDRDFDESFSLVPYDVMVLSRLPEGT